MPVHDWTKVDAGIFHHFHQDWTVEICRQLNAGRLPGGYFALAEQVAGGPIPDVLTLERLPPGSREASNDRGGLVATAPPRTRFIVPAKTDSYAAKANRVVVRHRLGEVVAVIEIVSPGNKDRRTSLRTFCEKTAALIQQGIHVLVVDLFPPGKHDPQGIHPAIWSEFSDETFDLPADKRLTLASYAAGDTKTAYVEPISVGDTLPDMPLFLDDASYVNVPLEATYETTWRACPAELRELLE